MNEQARQVIAETLMFEISDPRLRMVTIASRGSEISNMSVSAITCRACSLTRRDELPCFIYSVLSTSLTM